MSRTETTVAGNGLTVSPEFREPKISRYWAARYHWALTVLSLGYKNFGRQSKWAQKEMALCVGKIVEDLKDRNVEWRNNTFEVPSFEASELTPEFIQAEVKKARPFVLRGAANHWGAVQKWNLDFFADNFGEQTMTTKKSLFGEETFQEQRIADVVADLKNGEPIYSGFAEDVYLNNPSLHQDINREDILNMMGTKVDRELSMTSFFQRGTISSLQMFIQGADSHTTYHMTKHHNFFVEIQGSKEWIMVDPRWSIGINPCPSEAYYFISTQDVDSPDSPDELYSYVPKMRAVINPGDVLLIPSYWWHDVRTYKSDHVIGMAIRLSDWTLDHLLFDTMLLMDKKTIPFCYEAFIKKTPLTQAEDAVRHIDADLKRLGVSESERKKTPNKSAP